MEWVLAVVDVGLVTILVLLLLDFQKKAHALQLRQNPLRKRIERHQESVRKTIERVGQEFANKIASQIQGAEAAKQRLEHLAMLLEGLEQRAFVVEETALGEGPPKSLAETKPEVQETLKEARSLVEQAGGYIEGTQQNLDTARQTLALLEVRVQGQDTEK